MRSEDFRADQARPFTGVEYLESLRGTLGTDPSLTASREGL